MTNETIDMTCAGPVDEGILDAFGLDADLVRVVGAGISFTFEHPTKGAVTLQILRTHDEGERTHLQLFFTTGDNDAKEVAEFYVALFGTQGAALPVSSQHLAAMLLSTSTTIH